jgi:hypothetical protein
MSEEEIDYAWKFTGYPYLDGIIFGAGVPRNKNCVLINLSYCSFTIIEEIENKFNEIGYDAGCQEVPNGMTKETDLRLFATGPHPIYTTKSLPRFRERRLIIDETPIDFLYGFFTVSSKVKLVKYTNKKNYTKDSIMIRSALPIEDILQLLHRLEVSEYRMFSNHVLLERDMFLEKKPFEKIYQEFLKEDKLFGVDMTKSEIMVARMEEMEKDMWVKPQHDIFDDIDYEYNEPQ